MIYIYIGPNKLYFVVQNGRFVWINGEQVMSGRWITNDSTLSIADKYVRINGYFQKMNTTNSLLKNPYDHEAYIHSMDCGAMVIETEPYGIVLGAVKCATKFWNPAYMCHTATPYPKLIFQHTLTNSYCLSGWLFWNSKCVYIYFANERNVNYSVASMFCNNMGSSVMSFLPQLYKVSKVIQKYASQDLTRTYGTIRTFCKHLGDKYQKQVQAFMFVYNWYNMHFSVFAFIINQTSSFITTVSPVFFTPRVLQLLQFRALCDRHYPLYIQFSKYMMNKNVTAKGMLCSSLPKAYVECEKGHFMCTHGVCISGHRQCDGFPDCQESETLSSDETPCLGTCLLHNSTDPGIGYCIKHCLKHECICGNFFYYQCADGGCIPATNVCDGSNDCPHSEDKSDEEGCFIFPETATTNDVKIYVKHTFAVYLCIRFQTHTEVLPNWDSPDILYRCYLFTYV